MAHIWRTRDLTDRLDPSMTTWTGLESRLSSLNGWKRESREWHGPCPLTGASRRRCVAGPGHGTGIRIYCEPCGGRLSSSAFREHLAALLGCVIPHQNAQVHSGAARPARTDDDKRAWRHRLIWGASKSPDNTPGATYLAGRGVWPLDVRLPAAVRWLPLDASNAARPRLPAGAAGALVYRFAAPGEAATGAVQMEAIDDAGRRLTAWSYWSQETCALEARDTKRPSAPGQGVFQAGRRMFMAADGEPGRGCWLVEGPLDALALVTLGRLRALELNGAAVLGAAGVSGFTVRACHGTGPVTVAAQDDRPSVLAAVALGRTLKQAGRACSIRRPAHGLTGMDWASYAAELATEREEALRR